MAEMVDVNALMSMDRNNVLWCESCYHQAMRAHNDNMPDLWLKRPVEMTMDLRWCNACVRDYCHEHKLDPALFRNYRKLHSMFKGVLQGFEAGGTEEQKYLAKKGLRTFKTYIHKLFQEFTKLDDLGQLNFVKEKIDIIAGAMGCSPVDPKRPFFRTYETFPETIPQPTRR